MTRITATSTGVYSLDSNWGGGTKPGVGDIADAGDEIITLDEGPTVDSFGATGSGQFVMGGAHTCTGNWIYEALTTNNELLDVLDAGAGCTLIGDITNLDASALTHYTVHVGALVNIIGDVYGGRGGFEDSRGLQLNVLDKSKVIITGSVYEGTGTRNYAISTTSGVRYQADKSWQYAVDVSANVYKDQNISNTSTIDFGATTGACIIRGTVFSSEGIHEKQTIDMHGAGSGGSCFAQNVVFSEGNHVVPVTGRLVMLPGGTISISRNNGSGVYELMLLQSQSKLIGPSNLIGC